MSGQVTLQLFSKSTLPEAVFGRLIACCPAIDLAATVSADGSHVFIWRAGGQLVVKNAERGLKIEAIRWKEDGQFLAVGWSDGTVRLLGLENSKAVHNIRVGASSKICHIAWSKNYTGKNPGRPSDMNGPSWDKLLSGELDKDSDRVLLNLPHELTFLDIEDCLPKLSPLPVSGGTGDDVFVFSTRASLEFIFRPLKLEETDSVDVLIAGTDDGALHLSIYDTFVIGGFKFLYRDAKEASKPLHLCRHSAHPHLSSHSLLLKPQGDRTAAVHLVPMDIRFIYSSPTNLSLLASQTTTLQNLFRYVKQTMVHIVAEWKSTRELHDRFLADLKDELEKVPDEPETMPGPLEKMPKDLGKMTEGSEKMVDEPEKVLDEPTTVLQALYHAIATGDVWEPLREWIVEIIGERGLKRWDKAVTSGLDNLRDLVHENMLPALERCMLILSRLNGLAKFHDLPDAQSANIIGFTSTHITKLTDIISCLSMVCNKVLLQATDEVEAFASFSAWLHFEIDELSSSDAADKDELTESEAMLDPGKVLVYVNQYLERSPLAVFFDEIAKEDRTKAWRHLEKGPLILDILDNQFKKIEGEKPYLKAIPNVDFWFQYLMNQANMLFEGIAQSAKRGVNFAKPTKLDIGEGISKYDMRMCAVRKADHSTDGLTFVAVTPESQDSRIYIFRTHVCRIYGTTSTCTTSACGLSLGSGRIIDFKFLDDQALLVLWSSEGNPPLLLNIPYRSAKMPYADYLSSRATPALHSLTDDSLLQAFSPMHFAADDSARFTAAQMEVAGPRSSRGEVPARVCLLGSDMVSYKVFALPEGMGSRAGSVLTGDEMA